MLIPSHSQQWNTPPSTFQLHSDEIHVWQTPLVVPKSTFQQLTSTLSEKNKPEPHRSTSPKTAPAG